MSKQTSKKQNVESWETVATFVATFFHDNDLGIGAVDVEVQVGENNGVFFIRTTDDGGVDTCEDETHYQTQQDAIEAAEDFADSHNEANVGQDAEDYLDSLRQEQAEEGKDKNGEFAVAFQTAGATQNDIRERYDNRESAQAACQLKNDEFQQANPGTNLLCGFAVLQLKNGEWEDLPEE